MKNKPGPTTRPIVDRFWEKVNKNGALILGTRCWEWNSKTMNCGYGLIHIKRNNKKILMRAHRLSWEIEYGAIPQGVFICHHCDNRKCVRPSHLFPGTAKDNVLDMVKKKRQGKQKITHCPSGHPYSDINTAIYGRGRKCKTCGYKRNRKIRLKKQKELTVKYKNLDIDRMGLDWRRRVATCPAGHEYSKDNTYEYKNKRSCKTCRDAARIRFISKN